MIMVKRLVGKNVMMGFAVWELLIPRTGVVELIDAGISSGHF
jgi:hypothetical protein